MSNQLYIQYVLTSDLIRSAINESIIYFAQRRPRELAEFEWTIDAKSPDRPTPHEEWWLDTLGPLLESRSHREPFRLVDHPSFNYRFLDRKFLMQKEMWHPERPVKVAEGYDLKKMLVERISFVDSKAETLVQAVDILASFLRRFLAAKVVGSEIASALGKLQILHKQNGRPQSLRIKTISRTPQGAGDLYAALKPMTAAARTMIRPTTRRAV
jgi:hypothetical protein